jgi:hypothetical protein
MIQVYRTFVMVGLAIGLIACRRSPDYPRMRDAELFSRISEECLEYEASTRSTLEQGTPVKESKTRAADALEMVVRPAFELSKRGDPGYGSLVGEFLTALRQIDAAGLRSACQRADSISLEYQRGVRR